MPKFTFHGERSSNVELAVEADTFEKAVEIMQSTPDEKWDEYENESGYVINACDEKTGLWTEWQSPGWSDWYRT